MRRDVKAVEDDRRASLGKHPSRRKTLLPAARSVYRPCGMPTSDCGFEMSAARTVDCRIVERVI
jgi:hypothetical protein